MSSTTGPRRPSTPPPRTVKKQVPQKTIDEFWKAFTTKFPGKVHTIIPKNAYAKSKAAHEPKGTVFGQTTLKSYDEARDECVATVEKIAGECRRVNMRYRDPHFDIEFDLKSGKRDCLYGLLPSDDAGQPKSVKRVHQIFENPQFYVDDATSNDVRQGRAGDCWFLAALGALGNKRGLIDRVCVKRDEAVGVYGFVFHRDGEWIFTVIDDKLYLSVPDYDESLYEKVNWLQIPNRQDAEEEYRKVYQTGSRALYFAQCNTENETWLPLLEKAFAKAHGDYSSIDGGFTGEAIEDLTGGVTTELFTSDILDTERFWRDELSKVNEDFLFGCATGRFDDWQGGGNLTDRKGIQSGHAYSIMKVREVKGERLLQVRNPWSDTEWTGAWSDGSEQWNAEWMELLDHKFGNDGVFWISYRDLLRKYQFFDRTRLFGDDWKVTQQWTTLDVPWSADYNDTKLSFTITQKTPIVIVLSQLDDRYWDGLQGQYFFSLHFRVSKDGEDGYIVRSHGNYSMTRSVSTELELDAGTYSVLMKITAKRYQRQPTVEDVVRMNCKTRQDKLLQIGLSYDLAHAKGVIAETEDEKQRVAELQAREESALKQKAREEAKKRKFRKWNLDRKRVERARREKQRQEAHRKKKEVKRRERAEDAGTAPGSDEASKDESKTDAPAKADDEKPSVPTTLATSTAPGETLTKSVEGADVEDTTATDAPATSEAATAAPPTTSGASAAPGETLSHSVEGADAKDTASSNASSSAKDTPPSSTEGAPDAAAAGAPPTPEPETSATTPTAPAADGPSDSAKTKIDEFNAEPALAPAAADGAGSSPKDGPPAITINNDPPAPVLPTPPPSPGQLAVPPSPGASSDAETVLTYASSIDSELDDHFFRASDNDSDAGNGDAGNGDDDPGVGLDLEEFANDPWNAVCVVGLRLYTKVGDVSVKVARPREGGEVESPLDVDDPSKGLADEVSSPVRREAEEKEKKEDVEPRAEKLADVVKGAEADVSA